MIEFTTVDGQRRGGRIWTRVLVNRKMGDNMNMRTHQIRRDDPLVVRAACKERTAVIVSQKIVGEVIDVSIVGGGGWGGRVIYD